MPTNAALLNAIRRDASLEYRQRVPEITDGKIQKTIESIMEFQGIKNEMLDSLINRIGRISQLESENFERALNDDLFEYRKINNAN